MPAISNGQVATTKGQTTWTSADGFAHSGAGLHPLGRFLHNAHAYDEIYEKQLWPAVAVNKLTNLQLQLPGKTFQRMSDSGREDGRGSPFGQLMAKPSTVLNPATFWGWFFAMRHIHGCSFARKRRDRGGRPVELLATHPTRMRYGPEGGGRLGITPSGLESGPNRWWFSVTAQTEVPIDRRDFIYWPAFNPASPMLGMSPFEPLRDTLHNEASARAANRAMWNNGGKPSFVLRHPGKFTNPNVTQALADQFERKHGGVDQWGKPLVLQEGMEALPLNADKSLEYVETRKLNREEVAAAFDIPPPAIQILDKATYSNVTEQNRALYRQTMPPILSTFEEMIEFDLRDGRFGDRGEPDFGGDFYFEWMLDAVMRGAFEDRITAVARAIQTGQLTPAEAREMDNRPFIPGSDTLFLNGAVVPIEEAAVAGVAGEPTPVAASVSDDGGGGGNPGLIPVGRSLTDANQSKVMGRLSRPATLEEVDADQLVAGLDEMSAEAVKGAVAIARYGGCTVPQLREIIKQIGV